jgi:hypothetical protein
MCSSSVNNGLARDSSPSDGIAVHGRRLASIRQGQVAPAAGESVSLAGAPADSPVAATDFIRGPRSRSLASKNVIPLGHVAAQEHWTSPPPIR